MLLARVGSLWFQRGCHDIRLWKWLRPFVFREFKDAKTFICNAASTHAEGDDRTLWDVALEMEGFRCKALEEDPAAITMAIDLAKDFEKVQLHVVWRWRMMHGIVSRRLS